MCKSSRVHSYILNQVFCFLSPLHPHLSFFPRLSLPSSPPRWPSPFSPNRPQCLVLPSLCPCVFIFHHPPISENMRCFIFCSYVSLLRMMFSRFSMSLQTTRTHHFWLLHNIPWCICATFSQSSLSSLLNAIKAALATPPQQLWAKFSDTEQCSIR